jgi:predicted DNA-binding protein YlxM (UPF0122 family)
MPLFSPRQDFVMRFRSKVFISFMCKFSVYFFGRTNMTLTNAQISRIRELYSKGYSKTDIAEKTACSRKTVIKYLKGKFKPQKAKEKIEALEKEIEALKKQIERIPIKNLYDDFVCNQCGSKYLIAIHRCSNKRL